MSRGSTHFQNYCGLVLLNVIFDIIEPPAFQNIARGITWVISPGKNNANLIEKNIQRVNNWALLCLYKCFCIGYTRWHHHPKFVTSWCYLQVAPFAYPLCLRFAYYQKFSHKMAPLKFSHQMVPLAMVPILATRRRHLHCYIALDCPICIIHYPLISSSLVSSSV